MGQGEFNTLVQGSAVGRYQILRLLGEGGMGAVYEAMHRELGKRVAIKTLHRQYATSKDVRARFLREGQASSRIRHPHIVDVYDVAIEGELPYLVMEFLEGEDLSKLLRREGPLPVQRAADLMLPVLSAVSAAHDLGVIHRDLKPENVFICVERGQIKPKVVDFGISKLIDQEQAHALTGTAAILGTPYYMSPEQATGAKNLDARADQYSVGVILYECVVGRRPIEEPTLYALMHKIVTGDYAHPKNLMPALPDEFCAVIVRAMARDQAERFPSMRSLGHALLPFASDRARALFWDEFASEGATPPPVANTRPELSLSGSMAAVSSSNPASNTLGQSAQQLDAPAVPVSKFPVMAAALAALLVLGAGGWFALKKLRPEPAPPVASTTAHSEPTAVVKAPEPEPRPAVTPDAALTKIVQSEPAGAIVSVAGRALGPAPQKVEVPSAGQIEVELSAAGFETKKKQLSAGDPGEIKITMAPVAAPVKRPTPKQAPAPGPVLPKLAPR